MSGSNTGSGDAGARIRQWKLGRIDIRSPLSPNPWPVARLELEHPERGRVTDIAKAPGAFDAAFVAASQILGVSPKLQSYTVSSGETDADGALRIVIEVKLAFEEGSYLGSAAGVDLVRCSLEAWLDAVAQHFDARA